MQVTRNFRRLATNPTRHFLAPLYQKLKASHGNDYIGESVSQLEHFVLSAQSAELYDPQDHELITSAFLHDIGHQLKPLDMKDATTGELLGVHDHETLGANYLTNLGFSARVTAGVRNHVLAKRYLATHQTGNNYVKTLSPASQKTLLLQGGPLTDEEMTNFEKQPYFHESLLTRKFDTSGKDKDKLLRPLNTSLAHYFDLVCKTLDKFRPRKS